MRKAKDEMRKEYDFSQGVRGKHASQRLRAVSGARQRENPGGKLASKIQRAIEHDIKTREGFNDLWKTLDKAERDEIRAAWLASIDELLDEPSV